MNRLIISILTLLICVTAKGVEQDVVFYHENPIWFYKTSYGTVPNFVLQNNFDCDLCYNVTIVESSEFRYKVRVGAFLSSEYCDLFEAWTDKINCGVWLRVKKDNYIILYDEPDEQSHSTEISWDGLSEGIVLDYNGEGWVKILIVIGDKTITGWVDRYCASVYNSCA